MERVYPGKSDVKEEKKTTVIEEDNKQKNEWAEK